MANLARVRSSVGAGVRTATIDAAMDPKSDSKLKYVIMFGAPVIAGVALYWYMSRRKAVSVKKTVTSSPRDNQKTDIRTDNQRKVDDQINSKDPNENALGYKNKGNMFFQNKKYEEAVTCYTEAIKVCPTNETAMLSTFYQNRAATYENLQMYDNVIEDCNKALELNKRYSKAYFRRAKVWDRRGELLKCLEDATFCTIIEKFLHQPALQLANKMLKLLGTQQAKEIYNTRKPTPPSSPFIRNFLRSFVEDPVIIDLNAKRNNLPQENDQGPPSGYNLALQDLIAEDWNAVDPHCTEEIEKNQNKEKIDKALILRAGFSIITGKVAEALADINILLSRKNVDIKVRVNGLIKKATAELHCERLEDSLTTFQEAIELDPNNADIYLHKGQVLMLMDVVDETINNFSTAVSLRPDFVSPNVQLAYTEFRAGVRFANAELQNRGKKRFEECLKKFPNDSEVMFMYSQLMMGLGEYDLAEKYLNEIVKLDPKDSTGFVHLGILALQARHDVAGAVDLMQKAIEIDSKCQLAYETLGSLYMQTGRSLESIALLERGIALAQTEAEIAHLIGLKTTAEIQMKASEILGSDLPLFPISSSMN
ncbi:mitochondrial import receptor subunit TOM70-like [Tropilaelaps mercedesae]|uniref:Mitochondrial import receptor subunit TOM70-like n=1 Tax=Tropilaelaps mercedesae TaxID=418985 RepID=A0A1V9Y257_9ACAR|nr:mitochondrial import receptor subunit TOM70-like [Tropilaelaps mercedesae]